MLDKKIITAIATASYGRSLGEQQIKDFQDSIDRAKEVYKNTMGSVIPEEHKDSDWANNLRAQNEESLQQKIEQINAEIKRVQDALDSRTD